ncbi:MAG: DUF2238 domain-containing protein [Prosthecobacter sp.]|nr:DUF2238 domain-containing protein [Prosthecobacter sp.]
MLNYRNHALLLAALFCVLWIALAIHPHYREDWAMENVLLGPGALVLIWTYRRRIFSRVSYTLIFALLCFHEIGAHYTYEKVPYDAWWQALTGHGFNDMFGWQRNHFDRLVHFLYGLFVAYPVREIFLRVARVRGFWAYFLPLEFVMSTSAIFELLEWVAAMVAGGELGQAYVGTQGDVWDAQKDMALASVGALIAMLIIAIINGRCQRDFAQEWSRSLRISGAPKLAGRKPARKG